MFTGLIEACGSLGRITPQGTGARMRVVTDLAQRDREPLSLGSPLAAAPVDPYVMGESIAVDGVCLTVVAIHDDGFEADASAETLARTTLGKLAQGAPVNLERAMKLGGRMGGHIVTGHVDGVGSLLSREADSGSVKMTFSMPASVAPFVAEKGSIAVSGISLTVNGVTRDSFHVTVIPHTQGVTSLGALTVGAPVNLEIDLVARYVARLHQFGDRDADREWLARLTRAGYV